MLAGVGSARRERKRQIRAEQVGCLEEGCWKEVPGRAETALGLMNTDPASLRRVT